MVNGSKRPGLWPAASASIEAFFVRHRNKLVWVHGLMFLFFLAVILLPLFLPEPTEDSNPIDNFTRFANFTIWGLWFPLVFLSVIFTGRSWCGLLCPMGAASEWANKKGLQRTIPAWVRWEGTPIISFLIITVLGQTVGVRDHPEAMAEVFGGTMLAAILLGFIYGRNKRAWCRHMCPIGLLLGVFSRIGMVQFAPKRPRKGGDRFTEKTVCPTMIDIPRKEESRHCIECFRCIHPEARGGLFLRLRKPGEEIENIRHHHANPYEVWFLFMGTGIALGGFLWLVLPQYQTLRRQIGEWLIDREWFWIGDAGPWWLMSIHPERREVFNWLDFFTIVGFMLACMILITLVLGITTTLAGWLSVRLGGDRSFKEAFTDLGYQYAPVAMISLVIGLGAALFEPLALIHEALPRMSKLALFLVSIIWSLWLGWRILRNQAITAQRRWLPLLPGLLGSLAVGAAWWPGIFGL
ncbi:MAG TPA: 4Fe-4S binding protein [Thiolapillus brandeum]|uniref:4Fe-4S binding protein n=1 Tax=Thiolapillus brandeum TaxID=1076588 RepID=A0A831NVU1_9GAMM|nr:4Fe-4S binding protein [Thiolapillus brandeum]